jgi:Uma2 family endonuclease
VTVNTSAAKSARKRLLPAAHRWTREEYFDLLSRGYFAGKRVELVDGRIIDMPAQKNPHLMGIENTAIALAKAFGRGFWVRSQATLNLGPHSVPDPDVAVVRGPRRADVDYPTKAVLVVEVSDTTLWFDRTRKSRAYARAGVAEYWIVDLVHRQLEVYRNPVSDPTRQPPHQYAAVTVLGPKDKISPLAAPRAKIPVGRLLP